MWKSGHSLMKEKLHESGAPLGGEMSGHIFFGEGFHGVDDAHYAAIQLIAALDRAGQPLDALVDALPHYVNTPELRFAVAEDRKVAVVEDVLARLTAAGAAIDTTDGARVTTSDGWWLLRASNTQAALTVRAEARSQPALDRLLAEVDAQLAASGVNRAA